jgi:cell division protein FtsI (penicillin-binding protein 3)
MTRVSGRRPIRSRRSRARVVPLTQVPPKRLWIIFWILAAGLLGLVGRMAWLQLVQAPGGCSGACVRCFQLCGMPWRAG